MDIPTYVRTARKKRGMTQMDLANTAGVGLRLVRELERGKQTLRLDKVNAVLAVLDAECAPVSPRRVSEGALMPLGEDEMIMGFAASCVEDVANKLGIDYLDAYKRLYNANMVENYIISHYNVLHAESRENVTAGLIEVLKRREAEV